MTVAAVIQEMIESTMLNAFIRSPRFDDYKIISVDAHPTTMENLLEQEIKSLLDEYKVKNEEEVAMDAHVKAFDKFKKFEASQKLKQSDVTKPIIEGTKAATHPQGIPMMVAGKIPHVAAVLIAAQLAPMIIDELKRPGSFLDVRWKRIMVNEFNAFLDRQDQWNTQLGLRQVVVQSQAGFLMTGGTSMSENTLRIVRGGGTIPDTRLADQNNPLTDHTKELFD